jgi:hypothetical protein
LEFWLMSTRIFQNPAIDCSGRTRNGSILKTSFKPIPTTAPSRRRGPRLDFRCNNSPVAMRIENRRATKCFTMNTHRNAGSQNVFAFALRSFWHPRKDAPTCVSGIGDHVWSVEILSPLSELILEASKTCLRNPQRRLERPKIVADAGLRFWRGKIRSPELASILKRPNLGADVGIVIGSV